MKNIIIIATLDNRDQEISYLKESILRRGYQPLIIDIGFRAESRLVADIPADDNRQSLGRVRWNGILRSGLHLGSEVTLCPISLSNPFHFLHLFNSSRR